MRVDIDVNSRRVEAAFRRAPLIVLSELNGWITRTTLRTERAAKDDLRQNVSSGASGDTVNNIRTTMRHLNAKVEPRSEHAYWVHEGRKPGKYPPFQEGTSLNQWARRMNMNPFLVARSIARKGTEGHPFMDNAYKEVKPQADKDAERTLSKIVRRI